MRRPPRVAAIGGFMEYFEPIMGPDSRRDRTAHLDHTIAGLGADAELHNLGLLVDAGDEARLTEAVRRLAPAWSKACSAVRGASR